MPPRALALTTAIVGAANLIGPGIIGWLADRFSLGTPFVLLSCVTGLVLVVLVLAPSPEGRTVGSDPPLREMLRAARGDHLMVTSLVITVAVAMMWMSAELLIALRLDVHGFDASEIGLAFSASSGVFLLASAVTSARAERYVTIRFAAVWTAVFAASVLTAAFGTGVVATLVFLMTMSITSGVLVSLTYPLGAAGAARGGYNVAVVGVLLTLVWAAAGLVGPTAGAIASEHLEDRVWFIGLAVFGFAAAAWMWLRRDVDEPAVTPAILDPWFAGVWASRSGAEEARAPRPSNRLAARDGALSPRSYRALGGYPMQVPLLQFTAPWLPPRFHIQFWTVSLSTLKTAGLSSWTRNQSFGVDCTTSLFAVAMATAAAHVMPTGLLSRKMRQSVVSLTKSDVRHPPVSGSLQWNADRKYVWPPSVPIVPNEIRGAPGLKSPRLSKPRRSICASVSPRIPTSSSDAPNVKALTPPPTGTLTRSEAPLPGSAGEEPPVVDQPIDAPPSLLNVSLGFDSASDVAASAMMLAAAIAAIKVLRIVPSF